MSDTLHIALLGAGQLGGSFVLALREHGADIHVSAYDPSPTHAEELKARGGVDVVCATPTDAAKGADMVLLASPLRTYRALVTAIAPVLEDGCILTDLGSVKGSMATLASLVPKAHIVPAHPIAGSEKSGPSAARADLFKGKLCILTPDESTDTAAFQAIEELWSLTGADVIAMPHEVHDQIYAHVSHLPHYIAFVAAHYFHRLGAHVTADEATLNQFLRISRSNPRMWTDVALENREALLPVLGTYIALLEHFATELRMEPASPPAGEVTRLSEQRELSRSGEGVMSLADNPNTPSPNPLPQGGEGFSTPLAASSAVNPNLVSLTKNLLPRVLASSLISSVSLYEKQSGTNLRPFGGAGMRDIVAPAAVTPEADTEMMSNHASEMATIIEGIIPHFRALETMIGAEDEPTLYASISQMVEDAHALVTPRN